MKLEEKISTLNVRKQGFERNRNVCALVVAVLIYYMWQAFDTDSPELWFWFVMGGMTAIAGAILVYDLLQIKKLAEEVTLLEKGQAQIDNSTSPVSEENSTDDSVSE